MLLTPNQAAYLQAFTPVYTSEPRRYSGQMTGPIPGKRPKITSLVAEAGFEHRDLLVMSQARTTSPLLRIIGPTTRNRTEMPGATSRCSTVELWKA